MKISKKAIIAIKVIATILLLSFLLKRLNITEVFTLIRQINLKYLFLSALLYLIVVAVSACRWQSLLTVQGIKLNLRKLIRLSFIGYFFNNFLPTTVGGDVVKGYFVAKDTKQISGAYVSVLMDRLIGVVSLIFLASVIIIFLPLIDINRGVIYFIWTAFIFVLALLFFFSIGTRLWIKRLGFLKRIFQRLRIEAQAKRVFEAFISHKQHKKILMKTVFLSLIIQAAFIFLNYFIVKALPLSREIPLIYFFVYTPTIALLSSLPITLNGIGVRENLYVQFFSRLIGREAAGSLSIILLFFLLTAGLIGGICYLCSDFKIAPSKLLAKKGELGI